MRFRSWLIYRLSTPVLLLTVCCIDYVPPIPQGGNTPLMVVAEKGHLSVASLLVETYHCNVNEENKQVSENAAFIMNSSDLRPNS